MAPVEELNIEVAYAGPENQWVRELRVPPGTTIRHAVELSGVLTCFPGIDFARNRVGIYGALARLEDFVSEGDRIEIYRPLLADPKESRRQRATARKVSGRN